MRSTASVAARCATSVPLRDDAAGRVLRQSDLKSDDSVVSRFDYAYDPAGRRTRLVEADWQGPTARVTFSYDATGQLVGEWRDGDGAGLTAFRTTFVYDPVGNRLVEDKSTAQLAESRTTSVYDPANRLRYSDADAGRTTYSYDVVGNQTAIETPTGHVTSTTWDYDNFPIGVEDPTGDRTTMTYGLVTKKADRLRVTRETGCGCVGYLWDNQNILIEHDETGTTEAAAVYQPVPEPEPYGRLLSRRQDDESSYYHFDAQGTTAALTDQSGVIVQDYRHDSWGRLLSQTAYGQAVPNPYTYVGEFGYVCDLS
jgi:YD repeat-containing protein